MSPAVSASSVPVVLVTGASRRGGNAIARELHARGSTLVLHYRHSGTEAMALADELNARRAHSASLVAGDLALDGVPEDIVAEVLNRHGRLDGLVNNASSFYPTPLGKITTTDWDDLVGSNFRAPLFLSQAAAPALVQSRGAIVNIVDIHAERPLRDYPLYCAAKAALTGLTRALALELAPEVRVNGVAPGPIAWPEDDQFSASERAAIIDHTLLKREGSFADIAATVLFLLLDAPYVTGQIVAVDGGRSIHM